MKLSITPAIAEPCRNKIYEMMEKGAFPEANYQQEKDGEGRIVSRTYSLFDFTIVWSHFMAYVDSKMKESVDAELGVFTRKHSKSVLAELEKILAGVTEENVKSFPNRFATFFD